MIPFEALLPYGVMITFLTIGGFQFHFLQPLISFSPKVGIPSSRGDRFQRELQFRDLGLTGSTVLQTSNPIAPESYSNKSLLQIKSQLVGKKLRNVDKEKDHLVPVISKAATNRYYYAFPYNPDLALGAYHK